jgi:hypothetical protein
VQHVRDLTPIKARYGVERELQGCHTATVDGLYVIEGHVPADVIERLLDETPAIVGLSVPGMPVGSPGMEVPGREPERYDVLTFDKDGNTQIYARR